MSLSPEWRNRWVIGSAILLAIVCAIQIAEGSILLPVVLCGLAFALVLSHVQSLPIATLVYGAVLFGYIVGNRGFAQLSLMGGSPLLPAEFALLVSVGTVFFKCAYRHESPVRKDLLNMLVLLFVSVGSIRFLFDLHYGFLALRDYAFVYYAVFFFVAQYMAEEESSRRFLTSSLYVAGIAVLVVQPFYLLYPNVFLSDLTLRGIPVILYKGDLLASTCAITAILFFLLYEERRQFRFLAVSVGALGFVSISNSRAAQLGLLLATIFLVLGRRRRFALLQIGLCTVAAIVLLLTALARNKSWETTPVFDFYERAASLVDPLGKSTYRGETTYVKGDNNAFRAVWWSELIDETVEKNAWVGLGFGYDLAGRFLGRYYPTSEDDFVVRSPHNVLVTAFARMGFAGLLPFLGIAAVLARGAIRAVRRPRYQNQPAALWCSAVVLFTSACFGIVLEGPMGAVVFWTILGLANHSLTEALSGDTAEPNARDETNEELKMAPTRLNPVQLSRAQLQFFEHEA